jgi:Glycosyltransferase like family 2
VIKQGGLSWSCDAPPAECAPGAGRFGCVVAIPARDEDALIERCLTALAGQQGAPEFAVMLVLNNCRDATAARVRAAAGQLPYPLFVHEVDFAAEFANAAWARRVALNAAVTLAKPDGLLLTSDADSYPDPDWMAAIIECFDAGADLICGFVAPDFADAPELPFEVLRHGAFEFEYSQLTAELVSLIDPDPADPWPNHLVEAGANLAIRADALTALGGVPHVCPGEDQVLVRKARRAGYNIRHSFAPRVTTSSRLRGRAAGGWSDDLLARANNQRTECNSRLEPAATTIRRALLRRSLRACFRTPEFTRRATWLASGDALALKAILAARTFEEAWIRLEDASPLLSRRTLWSDRLEADLAVLRARVEYWRGFVEHGRLAARARQESFISS